MGENAATMVPDGVEFGIFFEKLRGEFKDFESILLLCNLECVSENRHVGS